MEEGCATSRRQHHFTAPLRVAVLCANQTASHSTTSRKSNGKTSSSRACSADDVPQFNISTPFTAANRNVYRPQDLYSHWEGSERGSSWRPSRWLSAGPAKTVVTAADVSHLGPLLCFLRAMSSVTDARVRVYNLGGLDAPNNTALMRAVGSFTLVQPEWSVLPVFARPNHALSSESKRKGEYSWKTALVAAELARTAKGACLIYLDAEVDPSAQLLSRFCRVARTGGGFASPTSPGSLRSWVHAGMPSWLEGSVPDMHARATLATNEQSCDAGMLAFIGGTATAHWLASVWLGCAMVRSCIAPHGSGRNNHRQDQSALSLFVHALQRNKGSARCEGLCARTDQQLVGQAKGQRRVAHDGACRDHRVGVVSKFGALR